MIRHSRRRVSLAALLGIAIVSMVQFLPSGTERPEKACRVTISPTLPQTPLSPILARHLFPLLRRFQTMPRFRSSIRGSKLATSEAPPTSRQSSQQRAKASRRGHRSLSCIRRLTTPMTP